MKGLPASSSCVTACIALVALGSRVRGTHRSATRHVIDVLPTWPRKPLVTFTTTAVAPMVTISTARGEG
jgi:hypothetical protein